MRNASDQRFIFPAQAEGILRGIGPDMTPTLKAKLKGVGLDPEKPFPPAWPAETLRQWLDVIGTELYRDFPLDEAHRRIGRRFIDGWQTTMLGAASAQVLKLLGPRRALERLTRAFRTGDNFSETGVTFPADRVALVTVRSQSLPHYIAGVLDGGLALLNVKGRVTIEQDTIAVMVFRVEWEP